MAFIPHRITSIIRRLTASRPPRDLLIQKEYYEFARGIPPTGEFYEMSEPDEVKLKVKVEEIPVEDRISVKRPGWGWDEVLETVRSRVPLTSEEVVPWMHEALAANILGLYHSESYSDIGGDLVTNSGDGFIPGVYAGNWAVAWNHASAVESNGYYVATNRATGRGYNVRYHSRQWLPGRGAMSFQLSRGYVQWTPLLAVWRNYGSLPITPDRQVPITNYYVYGDTYRSLPLVASYAAPSSTLAVDCVIQTRDSVAPSVVFTDANRTARVYGNLPTLPANTQQRVLIVASAPRTGYIEFYADGVSNPPTVLSMDVYSGLVVRI